MDQVNPIWIIAAAAAVGLLPAFVGLLTSYIKISIVLGMLRAGLGAQQVPSSLVVMALSLALTIFTMTPVLKETIAAIDGDKLVSFMAKPRAEDLAIFKPAINPWINFLSLHSGEREIAVLQMLDRGDQADLEFEPGQGKPKELRILLPAFVLSELKEGFAMAFVLLLPFLVVDLIVANILAGMGMFMVSPAMISLPLKLILFVMVDGWLLLSKGLIQSYQISM